MVLSTHRESRMGSLAKQRFSWGIASILIIINVLLMVAGCVVQNQAFLWFDDSNWQLITNIVGSLVMISGMGVVALICSWGPGPIWIRSLVLGVAVCLFALGNTAIVTTLESLNYEYYFSRGGVPMQIASQIGNGLSMMVPMMMVLSIIAALARWRIGPPGIGPIQIRIVDVMLGTAALAILFVANAEIQHQYYETMYRDSNVTGMDDFTSVSAQRLQTMLIAAISAPVAALVVSAAAWSLINRFAFLPLVVIVLLLGATTLAVDETEWPAVLGMTSSALLTCLLIATNVRLIGRAGWPLLRRTPAKVADADVSTDEQDSEWHDSDVESFEDATPPNSELA